MSEATIRVKPFGWYPGDIVTIGPEGQSSELRYPFFLSMFFRALDDGRRIRATHGGPGDDMVRLEIYNKANPGAVIQKYEAGGPGTSNIFHIGSTRVDVTHQPNEVVWIRDNY